MNITITGEQIMTLAAIVGAVSALWAVASKPFKAIKDVSNRLTKMEERIASISKAVEIQGDMTYQLLDHAATNNNSGEMQRALTQYNATFRHMGGNN